MLARGFELPVVWLQWLVGLSIATFALSALVLPWLLARLPEDHLRQEAPAIARRRGPWPFTALLLRNLFGLVLLVAGVLMLFLPGQGILTIVAGLWLCDLPGKRALERRLLGQAHVLASVNWIRARAGRPPLLPPSPKAR